MSARHKALVVAAGLIAMLGAVPARASCDLEQSASLDLVTTAEGMIAIKGSINGQDGNFLIDTGGIGGTLGFAAAYQQRLEPARSKRRAVLPGGAPLDFGTTVKRFAAGPLVYSDMWFLLAPDRMLPADMTGSLQPHLWNDLDVEIDFAKGKLNLFQQRRCRGHAVYWTHDTVAAVPMTIDDVGHISIQATVDGKALTAVVDSGAEHSYMPLSAAKAIFGIDEKSPGMTPMGTLTLNALVSAKTYRYPFQTINFEGIAIQNPDIVITDAGRGAGEPSLTIGIGTIRQLHLFIAYAERMLYLTAAEAR